MDGVYLLHLADGRHYTGWSTDIAARVVARSGHTSSANRESARWLLPVGLVLAAAELATNLLPLALAALSDPPPATAHTLTLAEDLADAAEFALIAAFSFVAAVAEPSWVRIVGPGRRRVDAHPRVRKPTGRDGAGRGGPLAFVAFVLVLSVRMLVTDLANSNQAPCHVSKNPLTFAPQWGMPSPRQIQSRV